MQDSAHELVATQGALWSDSTIIQVGQALMVTLRAEDIKHLSAVKTCFMTQLKSNILFISSHLLSFMSLISFCYCS